jgi:hypothetical protein
MIQYMAVAELEAQFLSEWVLLADPKKDAQKRLEGGVLVRHSKNRQEIDALPDDVWPKNFAVLYTGTVPHGLMTAL